MWSAYNMYSLSLYIQEVLTQVLEEAGYAKDSSLVLSDFVKVLKFAWLASLEILSLVYTIFLIDKYTLKDSALSLLLFLVFLLHIYYDLTINFKDMESVYQNLILTLVRVWT